MSDIHVLERKLKADERWAKYAQALRTMYPPQYNSYGKELETMHKSRLARTLSRKTSASKLMDANGQDQAYRSRCVEMLMQVMRSHDALETWLSVMKDYIGSNYGYVLSSFTTKGEREAVIDSKLASGYSKLTKLASLVEQLKLIISDIDQASFVLQRQTTLYLAITQRDKNLSIA